MTDYTITPHQEVVPDGARGTCTMCLVTDERLASWLHDPKNRGEENLARIAWDRTRRTYSAVGSGTPMANLTFSATITLPGGSNPTLQQLLEEIQVIARPAAPGDTNGASDTTFGDYQVVGEIKQAQLATMTSGVALSLTATIAVPAGQSMNVAVAFIDFNNGVGSAFPFETTVAQALGNTTQPTMPVGATFSVTSPSDTVGDQGYLSSSGLGGSPTYDNPQITATCTISESNTPSMATWSGKPIWGIRVHSASNTTLASTYTWQSQSDHAGVGNGAVINGFLTPSAGDNYDVAVRIPDVSGSNYAPPNVSGNGQCVQVLSNVNVPVANSGGRTGPGVWTPRHTILFPSGTNVVANGAFVTTALTSGAAQAATTPVLLIGEREQVRIHRHEDTRREIVIHPPYRPEPLPKGRIARIWAKIPTFERICLYVTVVGLILLGALALADVLLAPDSKRSDTPPAVRATTPAVLDLRLTQAKSHPAIAIVAEEARIACKQSHEIVSSAYGENSNVKDENRPCRLW